MFVNHTNIAKYQKEFDRQKIRKKKDMEGPVNEAYVFLSELTLRRGRREEQPGQGSVGVCSL